MAEPIEAQNAPARQRANLESTKICQWCEEAFSRPKGLSDIQWALRRFCSKHCAGMRKAINDSDLRSLYLSGKSSTEIALAMGISGAHALRLLKRAEVALRNVSEGKRLSHARPEIKAKLSAAATGRRQTESAKDKLRAIFGPAHPLWKSGITTDGGGYKRYTASRANGENAGKYLHRRFVEIREGRLLGRKESVHHDDHNKLNNSDNNLVLMSASEHAKYHARHSRFWRRRKCLTNASS
jgi:hypothetical protein